MHGSSRRCGASRTDSSSAVIAVACWYMCSASGRDQEPVGLGRLQHARHRALRAQCAGRGAGLHLLELVLAAGASEEALVSNVRLGLQLIEVTAPQLADPQRWFALVRCIVERILACAPKPNLGTGLGTGQPRKIVSSDSLACRFLAAACLSPCVEIG